MIGKSLRSLIVFFLFLFVTSRSSAETDDQKLSTIIQTYLDSYHRLNGFFPPRQMTPNDSYDLGQLPDFNNDKYFQKLAELVKKNQWQVRKLNFENLSSEHKIDHFLFSEELPLQLTKSKIEINKFLVLTQNSDAISFIRMADPDNRMFPFSEFSHYVSFIKRMKSFESYSNQLLNAESIGLSKGYLDSCQAVRIAIAHYSEAASPDEKINPFYISLKKFPQSISASGRQEIEIQFRKVITEFIVPAYRKISNFLKINHLPKCTSEGGLSNVKDGSNLYKLRIAEHTGMFLDPRWLFSTGIKEVRKIRQEIDKIKLDFLFRGSTQEFLKAFASRPDNYFTSKEEVLAFHTQTLNKINSRISSLFNFVPKTPVEIKIFDSEGYSSAFYQGPSESYVKGTIGLPGRNLKLIPKFEVVTLMMHEGVPGHHYQMSLQFENKNIPSYRSQISNSTSFIEGWALYAESLGSELDLFTDPTQKMGNLTNDMLRAVRLVVDSGLHYFGWTRAQAIQYMLDNLPYDQIVVESEVDRYISWPGQAIAYKVGQLKIQQYRKFAENSLGSRFDIKEFHRIVLESGAVSIWYLETKVKAWVNGQRKIKHN